MAVNGGGLVWKGSNKFFNNFDLEHDGQGSNLAIIKALLSFSG